MSDETEATPKKGRHPNQERALRKVLEQRKLEALNRDPGDIGPTDDGALPHKGRLRYIEARLLMGIDHRVICERAAKQFACTHRTVRRYIRTIYRRWEKLEQAIPSEQRHARLALRLERTADLARKTVKEVIAEAERIGDPELKLKAVDRLQIAINAEERLGRVYGIDVKGASVTIQQTNTNRSPAVEVDLSGMSDEELDALAALSEKALQRTAAGDAGGEGAGGTVPP